MPRITDGNDASANEKRFTYKKEKRKSMQTTVLLEV